MHMFARSVYELLDHGSGRKLERFAGVVLDRPAPASADYARHHPERWGQAVATFRRTSGPQGEWRITHDIPQPWLLRHDAIAFELKLADSGAVGIFPEQLANWNWLIQTVRRAPQPLRILNLFAYTGGATMSAAAAGAHVTHVDAARGVVSWARRCATHAGLADAPIRWICEDAVRFVEREIRRQQHYDGVILDPPTYGHGPKKQRWHIGRDLPKLLQLCRQLVLPDPKLILITCHSPQFVPADLEAMTADLILGGGGHGVSSQRLYIKTRRGHRLDSGMVARWADKASL